MLDLPALYVECAPAVHPVTMAAIVRVESGGNPLALHFNGLARQPRPAATVDEAVGKAEEWIASGRSVDIGVGQVNSANLAMFGLTVRQALDPCANLHAASAILAADYVGAVRQVGEGQKALLMALSAFNTGSYVRGFANGYVGHYVGGYAVPPLAGSPPVAVMHAAMHAEKLNPLTADTEVAWGPGGGE